MRTDTSAIEAEICNKLWEGDGYKLKALLSEYKFTSKGGFLQSSCYLSGAESGRSDKTKIGRGKVNRDSLVIFEQGDKEHNLINWLLTTRFGYTSTDKASYWRGLEQLGDFTGVEIGTKEEIEAFKQKQEAEEQLQTVMQNILAKATSELFTEEATETLNYLKGRGYSKEFINYAKLGAVTSEVKSQLEVLLNALPEGSGKKTLKFFFSAKEAKYNFVFPYCSTGGTIGLVFRSLQSTEALAKLKETTNRHFPKYLCFFPIEDKTTDGYPFGLNAELDCSKPVTIVEGGLDCLTARFYGVENIIAVWGTFFSERDVKALQRRGVQAVNLFFDTDNSEEKQQAIFDKMQKHSKLLEASSIKTYFAKLQGTDGVKVDIDSFLTGGGDVQELKRIIASSNSFHYMQAKTLIDHYKQGEHTAFERSKLLKALTELFSSSSIKPAEKAELKALVTAEIGDAYEAVMNTAIAKTRRERVERQITEAVQKKDFTQLNSLLPRLEGKEATKELPKVVAEGLKGRPKTAEEWRGNWSNVGEEVKTSYIFQKPQGGEEVLTLPAGAITLIGGYTSHGKSTFMQNIALDLLKKRRVWTTETGEEIVPAIEGKVIYFSLEESRTDTEHKLLNTFIGVDFSGNNKRALKHYYKALQAGEKEATKYFTGASSESKVELFENNYSTFKQKEKQFIEQYLLTGKLTVIDTAELEEKTAGNMLQLLEEIMKEEKIGAVFVDFLQELEGEDNSNFQQKRLELKDIASKIKDFATLHALPFVCAVQLNRGTDSPFTLSVKNIAESADIERYCNKAILLYNSAFPVTKERAGGYYLQLLKTAQKETTEGKDGAEVVIREEKLTEKAKALEERGWKAEKAGALYAVLGKNRGGVLNSNAVLYFEGNTGTVGAESLLRESLQQREAEAQTEKEKRAKEQRDAFNNAGKKQQPAQRSLQLEEKPAEQTATGAEQIETKQARPLSNIERSEKVLKMLEAMDSFTVEESEEVPF